MVIEDDESIRNLVDVTLSDEGCEVITAPNGLAALQLLSGSQPDVILLDLCMPVMDGHGFARAYAEMAGPHAPIVVLTATHDARASLCQIGAHGFLPKPFNLDDLVELVFQFKRGPSLV